MAGYTTGQTIVVWVSGELKISIGGRWPLAEAHTAQEALPSRTTTGKLLLRV